MSRAILCPHESEGCLKKAKAVILDGGILVYPTDTLYGFGVDPRNNSALEKLSNLKERGGPWSVAVADETMLKRYGKVSRAGWEFMKPHLPGKVTFVLKARKSDLSPYVLGKNNTIGMRIPHHPFPLRLTRELQFPITSTSVNKAGQSPLNDPVAINEIFGDQVDLISDDGVLSPSKGSRIYDLSGSGISILRSGQ